MEHDPSFAAFFSAFAELLLSTGAVDRGEQVTKESLDRALRTYIHKVIDDHNYLFGNNYDA
jgi:hypothetical protein